ncbi:hypothetical protein V1520DRAFT_106938 [Lipomyces starkeyi]|uniref:SMP-30/Gluconolactonase/LRE-like region domain-containing protein n=1 Tax=Lipomyces starkeyi NRRL Y-11557 TaxID=675824 RepID=A0A1E3Q116_LIPST|nr:hypothetical protein LIPSTDRAFT_5262 [Lipomyces starkeyi NRRL Y-11557]
MTSTKLFFLDLGLSKMKGSTPQGSILSCYSDGSQLQTVTEGITTAPDGLAVDIDNKHIYFTNMAVPSTNTGFISRIDTTGHNLVTIIPPGITWTPKQMTLERSTSKLYWSDREGMRVFRSNLDGSNIEILVCTGTTNADRADQRNWCVGIAVDPERKLIFWTQKGPSKGNQGRLFCAGMDIPEGETAENRSDKRVLLDHLPEPIDLDFDAEAKQLYMTDRGDPPFGNTVNKIDVRDLNRVVKTILVRKMHEAIGLAIDSKNRKMYMTDLGGSLYTANLDGSDEQVLFPNLGDLTGVASVEYEV